MNKEELIAYRNKLLEEQNKKYIKLSIQDVENDIAKVNVLKLDVPIEEIFNNYKHLESEQKAVNGFEDMLEDAICYEVNNRDKFNAIDAELEFSFYMKNYLYYELKRVNDTMVTTMIDNINEDSFCNLYVEISFSFFKVLDGIRTKINDAAFLDKKNNKFLVNYNIFANYMYDEGFSLNKKSFIGLLKGLKLGKKVTTSIDFSMEPQPKVLKKKI